MATRKQKTPRKKRAGRPSRAPDPVPPAPDSTAASAPDSTLEEFFVACQKSLARAAKNAQQAGKSASEFSQGERPLYMVSGFDVELSAALQLGVKAPDDESDSMVVVDFQAPADRRSKIRFRVDSHPMELLTGAKLEIASLDPLKPTPGEALLRVWLVDPSGSAVPGHTVFLHFARPGDQAEHIRKPIVVPTDVVGRVEFSVLTAENLVKVVGHREPHKVFLRGGARGKQRDEYFVWATCERKAEWTAVADPSPPRPPTVIHRNGDGLPDQLCSQLMQVKI